MWRFLAYLEHPLAPRPRPGQIVVLDRLGGAPQTGGAGGDRSAGVRVGAVAWVRPGLQPQRVGFQQDRGVRESCGGEDEGERWTLRSRLRWGRCRWGMWWVGLSMPESRITHCENRCNTRNGLPLEPLEAPHHHLDAAGEVQQRKWALEGKIVRVGQLVDRDLGLGPLQGPGAVVDVSSVEVAAR